MSGARLACVVAWAALSAATIATAQPAPDNAWLLVKVLQQDGKPLVSPAPTISLKAVDPGALPVNERPIRKNDGYLYVGVKAGEYTISVRLANSAATQEPTPIALTPGENVFLWHMGPTTRGRVKLQKDGEPVEPRRAVWALSVHDAKARTPWRKLLVTPLPQDGGYTILGLVENSYRLTVATDVGYGAVEFTVPDGAQEMDLPAIELTPGGAVRMFVTGAEGRPVAGARCSLRGRLADGESISVALRTDAEGAAITPMLPPGKWTWTCYRAAGHVRTGTLTMKDEDVVVVVDLVPPPPPSAPEL